MSFRGGGRGGRGGPGRGGGPPGRGGGPPGRGMGPPGRGGGPPGRGGGPPGRGGWGGGGRGRGGGFGGQKRPREWKDDYPNKKPMDGMPSTLRILMRSMDAGGIIGKGGENIKRMRKKYDCQVSLPDSAGSPERVLTIVGSHDNCVSVFIECLEKLRDEQFRRDPSAHLIEIQVLIPQPFMGTIIGTGGAKIKDLRKRSGCNIKIFTEPMPNSNERSISLNGSQEQIINCVTFFLQEIASKEPKEPIYLYDPAMANEVPPPFDPFGYPPPPQHGLPPPPGNFAPSPPRPRKPEPPHNAPPPVQPSPEGSRSAPYAPPPSMPTPPSAPPTNQFPPSQSNTWQPPPSQPPAPQQQTFPQPPQPPTQAPPTAPPTIPPAAPYSGNSTAAPPPATQQLDNRGTSSYNAPSSFNPPSAYNAAPQQQIQQQPSYPSYPPPPSATQATPPTAAPAVPPVPPAVPPPPSFVPPPLPTAMGYPQQMPQQQQQPPQQPLAGSTSYPSLTYPPPQMNNQTPYSAALPGGAAATYQPMPPPPVAAVPPPVAPPQQQPAPVFPAAMAMVAATNAATQSSVKQVTIPNEYAGAILGPGGSRLQQIRSQSGCDIKMEDAVPGSVERIITIRGSARGIQIAEEFMKESVRLHHKI